MTRAIEIDSLGKRYRLGMTHAGSVRELVNGLARRVVGGGAADPVCSVNGSPAVENPDLVEDGHFWALRDVSLAVDEGEVVGIIGANGAGKSTLLKLLSRVTYPTEGRIQLFGRVASLLEVGTGFHPELTGRENVFLNGAILGMRQKEIRRKFDEIADFSGVEKFLDTPVKRYSNGMIVRLGFAVAAHLEPEILVVDEVLAVGDAEFQRKCLGKMGEVAQFGRTVIFVSHNLAAVSQLCPRTLLLKNGSIADLGRTDTVIGSYLQSIEAAASQEIIAAENELAHPLRSVFVDVGCPREPKNGLIEKWKPRTFDRVTFTFKIESQEPVRDVGIVIRIHTRDGFLITNFSNSPESGVHFSLKTGVNLFELTIDKLALSAGDYLISAGVTIPNVEWLFYREHGMLLQVHEHDIFQSSRPPVLHRYPVPMEHDWHQR